MNNKGFVFTMLAIMITGIIVVFTLISLESVDAGQDALRDSTILRMMSTDLEEDVSRGLYITSFRTLIGQIEKTIITGSFLASTNDSFVEGMINGTIEGSTLDILENATFSDWLDKITILLETRSYVFEYEIIELEQFQDDAWHVSSKLVMDYNLTTPDNRRGYTRTINITAKIPIIGLEDPAYYIRSLGRLTNSINKSYDNDILFLIDESDENSLYIESNLSHNFLQRLTGDHNASPYGIESIVGGQRFKDQSIIEYDGRSSVDALYFIESTAIVQCVVGAPEWFRIDVSRIDSYSNLANFSC